MNKKQEIISMLKDTAVICAITVVTGLCLGLVYQITQKPIQQQEIDAKAEACSIVFRDSNSNENEQNSMNLTFAKEESMDLNSLNGVLKEQGIENALISEIYAAKTTDGELYGYVIGVIAKGGYGGDISFYMGVTLDGTCKGVSLLSISETPGLGMEAGKVLIPQFANKQVESFIVTKTGATAENEIDAITSATITSRTVTNGVNTGLAAFHEIVKGGEAE